MKVAVIGHTQGIGLACTQRFSDCTISGFSRSTGYVLPECIGALVRAVRAADTAILSAHPPSQADLFNALFQEWRYLSKHIVVIGSRAALLPPETDYRRLKRDLREQVQRVQFSDRRCRITLVNPGFIEDGFSANDVAEIVRSVVDADFEIGEISAWRFDK